MASIRNAVHLVVNTMKQCPSYKQVNQRGHPTAMISSRAFHQLPRSGVFAPSIHRVPSQTMCSSIDKPPVEDSKESDSNGTSTTPKAEDPKQKVEYRAKNFLHKVMRENKKWCHEHGFTDYLKVTEYSFLDKQTPVGTVLSCCDSRAPTSALGIADAPNEIFSIRNIGNQFANSIGSFRYGVEVLQTPYAIILGHTNCGAIRAAASDYRFLHTMVQQEVIPLVRVIRFADSLANSARIDQMNFDYRCNVYSEVNVDYQISRLLDDYQINDKVQMGTLNLIGMMHDIHNVYNKGYGRLHVVNINGDRDILSLQQHPLLMRVQDFVSEHEEETNVRIEADGEILASRLFSYSSHASQSVRSSQS